MAAGGLKAGGARKFHQFQKPCHHFRRDRCSISNPASPEPHNARGDASGTPAMVTFMPSSASSSLLPLASRGIETWNNRYSSLFHGVELRFIVSDSVE